MLLKKLTLSICALIALNSYASDPEEESVRLADVKIAPTSFLFPPPDRLTTGTAYLAKPTNSEIETITNNTKLFLPERLKWNTIDFKSLTSNPSAEADLMTFLRTLNATVPPTITLTTCNFVINPDESVTVETCLNCRSIDLPPSLQKKLNRKKGSVKRVFNISDSEERNIKDALAYLSSGLWRTNSKITEPEVVATLELAARIRIWADGKVPFTPTVGSAKPKHRRK